MKKEYRKPSIIFEDFTLSANIAGTCGLNNLHTDSGSGCSEIATFADENNCIFIDNGVQIFMDHCEFGPDDEVTDVCNHVPNYDTRIFGS